MREQPHLRVILERTGERLRGIAGYSIDSAFTTSSDSFEVKVAREDEHTRDDIKGLELEPVELILDGASQLLGRIEISDIDHPVSTFQGRDYIAECLECHIDPTFKVAEGMSIADVILGAASPVGISVVVDSEDIQMRNIRTGRNIQTGRSDNAFIEAKLKDFKGQPGQGIYELFNQVGARHGFTVQAANSRDTLALSAPNFKQPVSGRLRRTFSGGNVQNARAVRNYSTFPTRMIARGKGGSASETRTPLTVEYPLDELAENFNAEIAAIIGDHTNSERIKPGQVGDPRELYRFHLYDDETAQTHAQLERSARRRLSELLRPTLIYTCTVEGHWTSDGDLFGIDTILHVSDQVAFIDEPLWVQARKFYYADRPLTDLELWRPSTYVL